MSFDKRIAFTNKYNQRVMVRSIGIGDEHVEITETTNSALAKYFTNKNHALRMCGLIDITLGVNTRLEDRKQVYIITKVKRDCDEYLQAIVKGAGELPTPIWTKFINNALEFDNFDSMTIMCNFVDSLRENDYQPRCGHQMFYK
ncbi:hypothetical protein QJV38_07080 [Listeria cossartiae subsp. cayugensis]|uniref:Uncharacterized protein n=1 Tax=Listeria cossartiae subsp. cayugensis TaxID=2713505 RepID=A0ABU2IIT6_9LIST|nr:hypothetical protein [Listeria cossartiae]MDT0064593.1 hypothetical protein [Listeria cossartiae subsp. cayugensis]MDT0079803.1 hypothetical protein [Listeria cossartiae subsp. cayugensis]MDT0082639.1 hypothetical protein [Listeria cossartiae subsp. cayugensis]MDT0086826.1 hypothetical protein [Listeria cossartiae subsp. cayugensis]MDT0099256.1 hypothetical protein [Listeria cossartiae subsp. cayugensis]